MNMIAIDIGNTNITMGVFENSRLVRKAKMATTVIARAEGPKQSLLSEIASSLRVRRRAPRDDVYIIISSVVPKALARLKKILKRLAKIGTVPVSLKPQSGDSPYFYGRIFVAGENINVPIKNLYRKKVQVGQDRLVDAFAAKTLYGTPAVVIDFGTAITFDAVSRQGDYLGGLILPGIEMGLDSLHKRTALLPKVTLKEAHNIIGKDTADSMRGGILFGYGAMCDGLVAKYKKLLGNDLKVIATGGNARLIKKYTKSIQIVDEDLALKGLAEVKIKL